MENVLKLKNNGSILGLRELAKQLGTDIKKSINSNKNIVLDFDQVDSISSSFADELVAKIMIEVGQENFINHVKIRNTNNFIKTIINASIADRLQLNQ
ncbi:STAS-like domain-containing protein [bacterium]|nr:STAS-like domain-containing protein [bacterium]